MMNKELRNTTQAQDRIKNWRQTQKAGCFIDDEIPNYLLYLIIILIK